MLSARFGKEITQLYTKRKAMSHHNLKSYVTHFQAIQSGDAKADVRINDRNYQANDTVTLHEGEMWNGEFIGTGNSITAVISHVNNFGVNDGYVVLSLNRVGMTIADGAVELFSKD